MQGKLFDSAVKYLVVGGSTGDQTLVAAQAVQTPGAAAGGSTPGIAGTVNIGSGLNPQLGKIIVVSVALSASGASAIKFGSTTATNISGVLNIVSGTTLVLPYNPAGWFATNAAELLNLNVATTAVTGSIGYIVI